MKFQVIFLSLAFSALAYASDLYEAIAENDLQKTVKALKDDAVVNPPKPPFNISPLKMAVQRASVAIIGELLNRGAYIEEDLDGNTPLTCVASGGRVKVLKALLLAGADANHQDQHGKTPLMWAVVKNHKKSVKILLQHGVLLQLRDVFGDTAFMLASKKNHVEMMKLIKSWSVENSVRLSMEEIELLPKHGLGTVDNYNREFDLYWDLRTIGLKDQELAPQAKKRKS